ncbi:hypothetical protein KC347_g293 [Hortaea werneckii]|nr:hypothetical protein KC347_g293 [Hortaea werneckii]
MLRFLPTSQHSMTKAAGRLSLMSVSSGIRDVRVDGILIQYFIRDVVDEFDVESAGKYEAKNAVPERMTGSFPMQPVRTKKKYTEGQVSDKSGCVDRNGNDCQFRLPVVISMKSILIGLFSWDEYDYVYGSHQLRSPLKLVDSVLVITKTIKVTMERQSLIWLVSSSPAMVAVDQGLPVVAPPLDRQLLTIVIRLLRLVEYS